MGGAKKSTWIGGTAFLAVLMMAAAWFLAISPKMDEAAATRAETEQTIASNDILEMKVAKLKADFEKLPEYQAELAAVRVQIPTEAMLADYLRQIDAVAVAHKVTVTTITPSTPQTVVLATPAEAAAPSPTEAAEDATEGEGDEAEGDDEAEGTDTTAVPASTGGEPGVPAGFTAIPVSITVVGTYADTLAFLYDLQNSTARLLLVTGFTSTAQEEAEAAAGRPETNVGDQELVITGLTYVLPDALAVPVEAEPVPLQPAVSGKNPLVPIDGR